MQARKIRGEDSGVRPLPVRVARAQKTAGVVDQVRAAFRAKNRLAATVGLAIGGLVPAFGFAVAHRAHALADSASVGQLALAAVFVAAALLFSAPTVYGWAKAALGSSVKALGFVVLVEAAMVSAEALGLSWVGWIALAYLVAINAAATACRLALRAA